MNHIAMKTRVVQFESIENSIDTTTVTKAVNEAIEFCKAQNVNECELDYNGHVFYLNKQSDLKEVLHTYLESVNHLRIKCL